LKYTAEQNTILHNHSYSSVSYGEKLFLQITVQK